MRKDRELMRKFLILLLVVMLLCGCGKAEDTKKDDSDTSTNSTNLLDPNKPFELNDWQISVLESQGISTNTDALNDYQKYFIDRVYEMKKYLDDKYVKEFEYAGYEPGGMGTAEKFYAYAKDEMDGDNRMLVTVEVNTDESFKDNYIALELREKCNLSFSDYLQSYFGKDNVAIFGTEFSSESETGSSAESSATDSDAENGDSFGHKMTVSNIVFISQKVCDKEKFKNFVNEYYQWLCENGIHGDSRITVVTGDDFGKMSSENFTEYYDTSKMCFDVSLKVSKDETCTIGTLAVYEKNGDDISEKEEELYISTKNPTTGQESEISNAFISDCEKNGIVFSAEMTTDKKLKVKIEYTGSYNGTVCSGIYYDRLEHEVDGKWYLVPMITALEEVAVELPYEDTIDIQSMNGEVPAGHYRIIKELYFEKGGSKASSGDANAGRKIKVAAEFEIN